MSDNRWHIEGRFRDGRYRLRDENGQYKSVSEAILDETSEIDVFDENELADLFGIDRQIVLEHLGHLREEGLIEGHEGNWSKPTEFETQHPDADLQNVPGWASNNYDS